MKIFRNLFILRSVKEPKNDFSAFFRDSKSSEKKKVLKQAVRQANKDQKELVERYDKMFPKTT